MQADQLTEQPASQSDLPPNPADEIARLTMPSIRMCRLSDIDREKIQAEQRVLRNKNKVNEFYRLSWKALCIRNPAEHNKVQSPIYQICQVRVVNAMEAKQNTFDKKCDMYESYEKFMKALTNQCAIDTIHAAIEFLYQLDIQRVTSDADKKPDGPPIEWDMLGGRPFSDAINEAMRNFSRETTNLSSAHKLMQQFMRVNHVRADQCVVELHAARMAGQPAKYSQLLYIFA